MGVEEGTDMAGVTIEGKLWIDLGDVYAWAESRGLSVEWMTGVRFSIECHALVLLRDSREDAEEIDAAEIRVNGKKIYIGTFDTIDEASRAYKLKKIELHGVAI